MRIKVTGDEYIDTSCVYVPVPRSSPYLAINASISSTVFGIPSDITS